MIDLAHAEVVQVQVTRGVLWVNVNRVCALRIQNIGTLQIELPAKGSPYVGEIITEEIQENIVGLKDGEA